MDVETDRVCLLYHAMLMQVNKNTGKQDLCLDTCKNANLTDRNVPKFLKL